VPARWAASEMSNCGRLRGAVGLSAEEQAATTMSEENTHRPVGPRRSCFIATSIEKT